MAKSKAFPEFLLVLSAASGVFGLIVGLVHVFYSLGTWCEDGESSDGSISCIGPLLVWNVKRSFSQDSNGAGWRQFFTFSPDTFFDIWSPILVATLTLCFQFPFLSWTLPAKNWSVFSMWHLFAALFGTLGYGGSLGVITGLGLVAVSVLSLIVIFSGEEQPPCTFSYFSANDSEEENKDEEEEDDDDCSFSDTSSESSEESEDLKGEDGDEKFYLCKRHSQNSVAFVKLLAMTNSFLTLVVGIVHIANNFSSYCHSSDRIVCVGPLLEFNRAAAGEFLAPINVRWRNQISLVPKTFFDTFSPLIFGVFMLACYPKKLGFYYLVPNWGMMTIVYLCMALFANFGYAGNFGIIVGFLSSFVSFASLLIILTDNTHVAPFDNLGDAAVSGEEGGDDCNKDAEADEQVIGDCENQISVQLNDYDDCHTLTTHIDIIDEYEAGMDEEKVPGENEALRNLHEERFARHRPSSRDHWGDVPLDHH